MRTSSHNDTSGRYGRVKDTIYFYAKSEITKLNTLYTPYTDEYISAEWRKLPSGRYYKAENMLDPQGKMAEYEFMAPKPDGDQHLQKWKYYGTPHKRKCLKVTGE